MTPLDQIAVTDIHFIVERRKVHSVEPFANMNENDHAAAVEFLDQVARAVSVPQVANVAAVQRNNTVYVRNPAVEGPMGAFGYSYLGDKYGADNVAALRIRSYAGNGGQYSYEALNFVDGSRTVSDIRDWLTAELGEIPLDVVAEYLEALESIDVIRKQE